ncbi:hypothetical protein CZ794_07350 [Psychrobacter sp. JB385]|nr:hypothetical protein CZ794_07350 [Psychrobacter sp. JB385]
MAGLFYVSVSRIRFLMQCCVNHFSHIIATIAIYFLII